MQASMISARGPLVGDMGFLSAASRVGPRRVPVATRGICSFPREYVHQAGCGGGKNLIFPPLFRPALLCCTMLFDNSGPVFRPNRRRRRVRKPMSENVRKCPAAAVDLNWAAQ